MKSQSEIYTIKQQIESCKSQIRQCQANIDGFEGKKKDSPGNDSIYDKEISSQRDRINQIQRDIDRLIDQLST